MPKSNSRYLDYAAGVLPNPSTIHVGGVAAKGQLELARKNIANILRARPEEIIFTSGGTESNNLAIQGTVFAYENKKDEKNKRKNLPHIILSNIEHPSVLETSRMLERRGLAEITLVAVEPNGVINPKKIIKEIKKNTALITIMYVNNEIGTIQPVAEIAKEIRHYKKHHDRSDIYFHVDAVQAVNYLPLDVEKLGVDMLSISGSKIEGSGRVGILYKKNTVTLENLFGGGSQEGGLRPGTENLPAILSFADALAAVEKIKSKEVLRLTKLRDNFLVDLKDLVTSEGMKFILNGDPLQRLPNNVNISIGKIPSDLLVIELSSRNIMASAKSACKANDPAASHVIRAIRPGASEIDGSLRFSFGRKTTKADLDHALASLAEILKKLKKWYN